MRFTICCLSLLVANGSFAEAKIIAHASLKSHGNNQNTLTGVATPSLGATQSEVWHSSIGVGSQTPPHTHEAEEIVILLAGTLEAMVGGKTSSCEAPCTIILPPNISHQLINTGKIATDHYLVMPLGSKIIDDEGKEMNPPWRR